MQQKRSDQTRRTPILAWTLLCAGMAMEARAYNMRDLDGFDTSAGDDGDELELPEAPFEDHGIRRLDNTFLAQSEQHSVGNVKDNCCVLWEDREWRGRAAEFCLDEGKERQEFYLVRNSNPDYAYINDRLSSYSCGKNVRYQFCHDEVDERCHTGRGISGAGPGASTEVKPMDASSSVILTAYDDSEGWGAGMLFSDRGCTGRSGAFFASPSHEWIPYDEYQMWHENFYPHRASSVRLGPGYELELFSDHMLTEKIGHWYGGLDIRNQYKCQDLSSDQMDKEVAVAVRYNPPGATGRWDYVAMNVETYEMTQAWLQSSTEVEKNEKIWSINAGIEAGLKFGPASLKAFVNTSYKHTTMNMVTTVTQEEGSVKFTGTCTPPDDQPDAAIGLWQYVVIDDRFPQDQVRTNGFACRYGEDAGTPPACPPNACILNDCSSATCENWQLEP